jgi:hypothetical protein
MGNGGLIKLSFRLVLRHGSFIANAGGLGRAVSGRPRFEQQNAESNECRSRAQSKTTTRNYHDQVNSLMTLTLRPALFEVRARQTVLRAGLR